MKAAERMPEVLRWALEAEEQGRRKLTGGEVAAADEFIAKAKVELRQLREQEEADRAEAIIPEEPAVNLRTDRRTRVFKEIRWHEGTGP